MPCPACALRAANHHSASERVTATTRYSRVHERAESALAQYVWLAHIACASPRCADFFTDMLCLAAVHLVAGIQRKS